MIRLTDTTGWYIQQQYKQVTLPEHLDVKLVSSCSVISFVCRVLLAIVCLFVVFLFSLNHCILCLHWLLPSDYPCYLQTLPTEDDRKISQTICSHESGIETRCSGGVSISIFINDSCGECLISKNSNTMDAISWAGTAFPFGASEFTPCFQWGSCYLILSFMCNIL